MDCTNMTVTFNDYMANPRTIYNFGKSRVEVTNYKKENKDEYLFIYENEEETKLVQFTEEMPELFKIYIKRLYEAFDITNRDIESCIKSIQAWKRRRGNQ